MLQFLDVKDLIPAEYRQSSAKEEFFDGKQYNRLEDWWYVIGPGSVPTATDGIRLII